MFVRGTVFILATLAILFLISPVLAGSTLGGIVPIIIFASIYGGKIRDFQKNIQEEKALMSNVADESFGNVRTVKAFSNELEETNKF
jgi:ABC-type multidrug transport system fused ATPase/permease subunit